MTELPRRAVTRTAKLAALPLSYAGRSALGLGKRLGGAPAEAVFSELQQRTAEQIFRTLGELKGGAMKVGQALSIFESALPDEIAAPYREQLTKLQDSAPPMPTMTVRQIIREQLGSEADHLSQLDGDPAAAASIGQVHRAVWAGTPVAVKVQYPGAAEAMRADLRQLARLARGVGPVFPGVDLKALVEELRERTIEELDYRLEAEAQRVFAAAYAEDEQFVVPQVLAGAEKVLVTSWMDSTGSLAQVIREGTQAERDHYGELFLRFLFGSPARTGMLHADPHPGNFRLVPGQDGAPDRLGVVDYGAVARLPGGQLPAPLGRLIRIAADGDFEKLTEALREEGFIREKIKLDPEQLERYLGPFLGPARSETFTFDRAWMQTQFQRVNDPRSDDFAVALKLNLPPSYLLIHRAWTGGVGVLSQLGATVPFRGILEESLPGFADPVQA